MGARRKVQPTLGQDYERRTEMVVNGRRVVPGTEISIYGESGRFRFIEHVITPAGAEWINVFGGTKTIRQFRSFLPERIKTVHRIRKLRE